MCVFMTKQICLNFTEGHICGKSVKVKNNSVFMAQIKIAV
jgi:hypothetical protein